MSAKLRRRFYTSRVKGLQNCDSRTWFTGQKKSTSADMIGMANYQWQLGRLDLFSDGEKNQHNAKKQNKGIVFDGIQPI